jgi:hypothetical protein
MDNQGPNNYNYNNGPGNNGSGGNGITVVTDLVETVAETTVADRVSWHLSC